MTYKNLTTTTREEAQWLRTVKIALDALEWIKSPEGHQAGRGATVDQCDISIADIEDALEQILPKNE